MNWRRAPVPAPLLAPLLIGRLRWLPISPLTLRILAVNVLALAMLLGGVLYLNQFQDKMIDRRIEALAVRAEILAGAIAESASGGPEAAAVDPAVARTVIARLVGPTRHEARLFAMTGEMVADSRFLGPGSGVRANPLPPLDRPPDLKERFRSAVDGALDAVLPDRNAPPFPTGLAVRAEDLTEVTAALEGDAARSVRRMEDGTLMLSVAVPVQRFRRVLGALLLSSDTRDIETAVRDEQMLILGVFGATLAVTLLLTLFLAGTIARPIRQLAVAAERVRGAIGREARMPQFPRRRDEIGELARSLAAMTEALHTQLDRVEAFAADVAHELKNPLSSLRSAVDSLQRTDDPAIKQRLYDVIQSDVRRLDRLISDISEASRLDAALSRGDLEPVDLAGLAAATVDSYRTSGRVDDQTLTVTVPETGAVTVAGVPDRLAQLLCNLIDNALSFTPAGGAVRVAVSGGRRTARLTVEDDGPGLPAGAEEKIFTRFYSERPSDEDFGTHSGLGLSICQQVVAAHGGTIRAETIRDGDGSGGGSGAGAARGARFEVLLPRAGRAGP
ncbi:stimulus-sensing domain-containing protein [Rhodothalassium salexigens]|uniref:stimulus-sensing domain-containing protein n=1 Tax=Rhodothalassium salexigens TaxID=1086 RepID=UPI001914A27C|nr:stimulus-sensing domain-containing protein [Rhodothalassium salexigens]